MSLENLARTRSTDPQNRPALLHGLTTGVLTTWGSPTTLANTGIHGRWRHKMHVLGCHKMHVENFSARPFPTPGCHKMHVLDPSVHADSHRLNHCPQAPKRRCHKMHVDNSGMAARYPHLRQPAVQLALTVESIR